MCRINGNVFLCSSTYIFSEYEEGFSVENFLADLGVGTATSIVFLFISSILATDLPVFTDTRSKCS